MNDLNSAHLPYMICICYRCCWPGLAAAAGLVRADRAVRSADGPGRAAKRRTWRPPPSWPPACFRSPGLWLCIRSGLVRDASHAAVSGDWYVFGVFGSLRMTIGYYIDSLTVAMFCMVTLVASCIHVYSIGYMHGELST